MATNVYIKQNKEVSPEELKYIEELKSTFVEKTKVINEEKNKIKDYETLRTKLESLHIKMSYDIMVPVSQNTDSGTPLCYISSKLVHTNEVFMPLGAKYYTRLSTHDSIDACNRKIEEITEEIIELEMEKKLFLEKMSFLQFNVLQPGQVEIIEEYPAEEMPKSRWQARKPKTKTENET